MNESPRDELIRKLQNNGMPPASASAEVAKAMAMSPSDGAAHLKQLGLDYLDCFKVLSAATVEENRNEANQGEGLFAVIFPWRLSRGDYLLRYLFFILALILTLAYPAFIRVKGGHTGFGPPVCIVLALLYKIIVMDAARFRDLGKSGFLACVMIIPVANLVAQFFLWFTK